jgi:hypothetical protein
MKITVEIPDALLAEARASAAREGTTLSALVERALHRVVSQAAQSLAFKLRRASFKGKGLQRKLRDASWERILELSYRGRGG